MSSKVFTTVIYHAGCPDGFTAAWAFWRRFGDTCKYVPCRYGQPPPDVTGQTVAIVDFSFKRNVTKKMASTANYLVVLDHHRTAEKDLKDLNIGTKGDIIFDMSRSGAQIAWDWVQKEFYPDSNSERPWFVEYVADRDLWQNKLPNTKEIQEALFFDGYFHDFIKLQGLFESPDQHSNITDFITRGSTLLEYKNSEIIRYSRAAKPAKITVNGKNYTVALSGCPRPYRSDVGNAICENMDCDFAGVYWYDFQNGEWWVSFRASASSTIDLSEITSHLPQGGGHPKAAGFTIYSKDGQDLRTYFTPLPQKSHHRHQNNNK